MLSKTGLMIYVCAGLVLALAVGANTPEPETRPAVEVVVEDAPPESFTPTESEGLTEQRVREIVRDELRKMGTDDQVVREDRKVYMHTFANGARCTYCDRWWATVRPILESRGYTVRKSANLTTQSAPMFSIQSGSGPYVGLPGAGMKSPELIESYFNK